MKPTTGLALAAAALLSGCLGGAGEEPSSAAAAAEADGGGATAALEVQVRAAAGPRTGEPVPDATVNVDGRTVQAPEGNATVEGVPVGAANVTADAAGYRPAQRRVEVPDAGGSAAVALHPEPLRRNLTGRYDCTSATLIAAGDCLVLADAAADAAGAPLAPGNLTDERGEIPLDLPTGWSRLDLRIRWTPENPTTRTLRLEVEPGREGDGRSRTPDHGQATGTSPLTLALQPDVAGPNATTDAPPGNASRTPVDLKVYPPGVARGAAGSDLLGAAVALDQSFTLHLELRYHEPGDPP